MSGFECLPMCVFMCMYTQICGYAYVPECSMECKELPF